jgi:Protein of unknown function (DUF2934)
VNPWASSCAAHLQDCWFNAASPRSEVLRWAIELREGTTPDSRLNTTTENPPGILGDRFNPTPRETAALAYDFWERKQCPIGSPDEDWSRAEREFEHRETPGSVL